MTNTQKTLLRRRLMHWITGGLGVLLAGNVLPGIDAQEPAPLLARPASSQAPMKSKPRMGLGNPVPASSLGQPSSNGAEVQRVSLQIEKPLPKPVETKPTVTIAAPEQLHMPAPIPTGPSLPPPGSVIMSPPGLPFPQTVPPGSMYLGSQGTPMTQGMPSGPVLMSPSGMPTSPVVMDGPPPCCAPGSNAGIAGTCPPNGATVATFEHRGPFTSLMQHIFSPLHEHGILSPWNSPVGCADMSSWNCPPIQPHRFRVSFEYLLWTLTDDESPPLVTSGPPGTGAVLGAPGTSILFGGPLDQGRFSGGRLSMTYWFDNKENLGLDGGIFMLGQRRTTYSAGSQGTPVVAHPFFEADENRENSAPVAGTDTLLGDITGNTIVSLSTRMLGADLNLRKHMDTGCWMGCTWHWDGLAGFRYVRLDENLTITDNILCLGTGTDCPAGTQILAQDQFKTLNNFYGGQVGLELEMRKGRWGLNLRGKVAAGMTQQSVFINGATTFLPPTGGSEVQAGGVFALPSNKGVHDRSVFSVVPELGLVLSYQLNEQWRIFAGYNAMVWTNVVRPGKQIDRVLDSANLLPRMGTTTPVGTRPLQSFNESTIWAHGFTGGLEWRF